MWYILGWNPASIQVQREPWWEAFCVILLTSQPTNQLTDMGEYIASLAEVIVTLVPWQNVTFALPVSIKPNGYVKAICDWVYIWRRRELTAHTQSACIFSSAGKVMVVPITPDTSCECISHRAWRRLAGSIGGDAAIFDGRSTVERCSIFFREGELFL